MQFFYKSGAFRAFSYPQGLNKKHLALETRRLRREGDGVRTRDLLNHNQAL